MLYIRTAAVHLKVYIRDSASAGIECWNVYCVYCCLSPSWLPFVACFCGSTLQLLYYFIYFSNSLKSSKSCFVSGLIKRLVHDHVTFVKKAAKSRDALWSSLVQWKHLRKLRASRRQTSSQNFHLKVANIPKITHTVKQKIQICAELNDVSFVPGKVNSIGVIFEARENFSVRVCVLFFLLSIVFSCVY